MKAGLVAAWLLLVGVVLGQVYGQVYSWSIFRLLAVLRRYGL
jgi:hypothetical protein